MPVIPGIAVLAALAVDDEALVISYNISGITSGKLISRKSEYT